MKGAKPSSLHLRQVCNDLKTTTSSSERSAKDTTLRERKSDVCKRGETKQLTHASSLQKKLKLTVRNESSKMIVNYNVCIMCHVWKDFELFSTLRSNFCNDSKTMPTTQNLRQGQCRDKTITKNRTVNNDCRYRAERQETKVTSRFIDTTTSMIEPKTLG